MGKTRHTAWMQTCGTVWSGNTWPKWLDFRVNYFSHTHAHTLKHTHTELAYMKKAIISTNTFYSHNKMYKYVLLSHTPDRCSEMCCSTGSAIVVRCSWSKLGTSTDFPLGPLGFHLVNSGIQANSLTTRLPAALGIQARDRSVTGPTL